MSSNQRHKGGDLPLSPELREKLRELAQARGLPADMTPEEIVLALTGVGGETDISALLRELSKALDGLEQVAEGKGWPD